MNKQIEALKMAIEAMETSKEAWHEIGIYDAMYDGLVLSIQACKDALAEAEKQEWQSLSDDEMDDLFKKHGVMFLEGNFKFARAIEQELKEKNHA